jgi:hypothetical protein
MGRAMFRDTILVKSPNGLLSVPNTASVSVYDVGTSNPISDTLYADDSSGTTLANPLAIGADGTFQFWTLTEREMDVVVTTSGYQPVRTTVMTDAAGWG